jgi:hypothetical protein
MVAKARLCSMFILSVLLMKHWALLTAFAATVWLNGHFVKTTYGKCVTYCSARSLGWRGVDRLFCSSTNNKNIIRETNELYHFPRGAVRKGHDNVITILQDNMGLEEDIDCTSCVCTNYIR